MTGRIAFALAAALIGAFGTAASAQTRSDAPLGARLTATCECRGEPVRRARELADAYPDGEAALGDGVASALERGEIEIDDAICCMKGRSERAEIAVAQGIVRAMSRMREDQARTIAQQMRCAGPRLQSSFFAARAVTLYAFGASSAGGRPDQVVSPSRP